MYINIRGSPEKPLNCSQIKVLSPSADSRPAKKDLGDLIFLCESSDGFRNIFPFQPDHLGLEILRKSHIGCQGMTVFLIHLNPGIHVDDVEVGRIDALGESGASGNEMLGCSIRANADGNSLAYTPVLIDVLVLKISLEVAIDRMGDLTQRKLAQRHQISTPEEI
jgi:hypothetical protein